MTAVAFVSHVLVWARECARARTATDPAQSCGSEFITTDGFHSGPFCHIALVRLYGRFFICCFLRVYECSSC